MGLYLAETGVAAGRLGVVVGAGLTGIAVATALTAWYGERIGRRVVLNAATLLSAAGLAGTALVGDVGWLALVAGLGLVNGMGRDRGPAQVIEQSILADAVRDASRTRAFVVYNLAQDLSGALGSLAAGLPTLLRSAWGFHVADAYRWTFLGAAVISLFPLIVYQGLPAALMQCRSVRGQPRAPLSRDARHHVARLSGLFALDSLGGGFLAGSILSYWFFRRFGLNAAALGAVFFAARALNALSYPAAEFLARRIGLVRTMVFTHLPSSAVLLALPFVPTPGAAVAVFLVREAVVQMDVPTRQSYVAALTSPGERTFALGVTGLVRNVGWAAGPAAAGASMRALGLGAPLVIGAVLKIVYDLALFGSHRTVRPPEEEAVSAGSE